METVIDGLNSKSVGEPDGICLFLYNENQEKY